MFDTIQLCKFVRQGKEDIVFSSPCFNVYDVISFAQGVSCFEKCPVKIYLRVGSQEFNYLCDVPYVEK